MFSAIQSYTARWLNRRYWRRHGLQQALEKSAAVDWKGYYERFIREIDSRLRPGMSVIELGCSGGHWFERLELQEHGCQYVGVDVCPDSIALAKQRFREAEFRCRDIATLTDLGSFDYIIACQVLFFLDRGALEHLLSQMRPGAFITISEPSFRGIESYADTRPKKRTNGVLDKVVYLHPYPAIFRNLGFSIESQQFTESSIGKVKLVMTARAPGAVTR